MGKPLSRPGCFRKSSCCLEKHGFGGDGGVGGGRDVGLDGGYGDGYVPQRSIYDTMCINQQIDNHHHHHHHHGGSMRHDGGSEGSFYSASSSLRMSRAPGDMFDQQPRSLTPNPSFVRRLDERAIFDSLKLEGHDIDGMCPASGDYGRSVSPAVSSFSAPGISSSSSKKHHHHHHHHHGDSTKSRESRHSWKVITPPKQIECMELTTADMIDRGGGPYLNPGHYPPSAGQTSSLTSPLISPFSGSPLSSGYHTPVFFSPAKPRPSQSQSLRCSPPHVMQPTRHYSQTQSLRMSPPHELRRSPYRAQLVQLSAHDLEQDLRGGGGVGGGGWGRSTDREREWERERERELERGWAQREWERERERGRLERERARERERRENSFGTFGYGRPVPLRSDRDSVFLEPDPMLDTTPLLLPQPSPSPSPSGAPRMGTGAVGRNRAGSTKVGPDCLGGGMVLVDGKPSHLPRLVSEISHVSDAEMMMQERHRAESWSSKPNNGSRSSFKNEVKMGSQVKTRPVGRDLEGKVQSGMQVERGSSVVNHRESHRGKSMDNSGKVYKAETITNIEQPPQPEIGKEIQQDSDIPPSPYPVVENKKPFEIIEQVEEQKTEVESTNQPELDTSAATEEMSEAQAQNTEEAIVPTAEPVREEQPNEPEMKGDTATEVVKEVQKEESENALIVSEAATIVSEKPVEDKRENKPLETDKIESKHVHKSSKSHKHKSSKSSSRSRPGTATGSRPGVLSRGLRGLESPSPIEGIESTWPRRMMVRKRTVRQGGALHNLPILPPLPSVLSALEKRRPHGHHLHHHSENPLSNITNSTSIVGRCSLKEPSHFETGQGISPVGRASLKEQNLESWRVRDQDDMQRSRSREKSVEKELKMPKERKKDDRSTERQEDVVIVQKENVQINIEFIQEIKQDEVETSMEIRNESSMEIQPQTEQAKDIKVTISEDLGDQQANELEEIVAKFSIEEPEGETVRYRDDNDSWDDVLGMVNTLWDEGWEKARVEVGEGDADSLSGSLQRWPLLRPPVGFGGSHPPSSAASELSLTELERRARELDSDLEHLDLSQPHREGEELYPPLHELRERPDMYQTHPGPQRDKTTSLTGVGSRSQVNLELTSPTADSDRPPSGTSPAKEDSSPDSNLTLESDSSGIFLSLSNQSQEEAGSDSDQPISGSDLGSSSTSLDKDGDDGLKEWGREESAELQWCYPSLLNTSMQDDNGEDIQGQQGRDEAVESKISGKTVSIIAPCEDNATHKGQELPPRKKVTIMGGDSPLCRSPIKQPFKHHIDTGKKATRTSGLDCGDIDPFAQTDSFVYLAVSARPPTSHGEVTAAMLKGSPREVRKEIAAMQSEGIVAGLDQAQLLQEVKAGHLVPQKPEEGDFLCTDSFVYLAAPACLLLGPPGTTGYSGRDSDSESSDSGPVEVSVHGCGSVAGDSDWDSDLSDSDPTRPPRTSSSGTKASSGTSRSKRPPAEPQWDMYEDPPEPECVESLGAAPSSPVASPSSPTIATMTSTAAAGETSTNAKRVTWQFKPAQRSVCTGSRKEKEMTSPHRPPPSSSSSSSSSSPSSSSG